MFFELRALFLSCRLLAGSTDFTFTNWCWLITFNNSFLLSNTMTSVLSLFSWRKTQGIHWKCLTTELAGMLHRSYLSLHSVIIAVILFPLYQSRGSALQWGEKYHTHILILTGDEFYDSVWLTADYKVSLAGRPRSWPSMTSRCICPSPACCSISNIVTWVPHQAWGRGKAADWSRYASW